MNNRTAAAFVAHLQKHRKDVECPFCKGKKWDAEGPVGHMIVRNGALNTGKVVPTGLLTCTTCAFVYQFSWTIIMRAAGIPQEEWYRED